MTEEKKLSRNDFLHLASRYCSSLDLSPTDLSHVYTRFSQLKCLDVFRFSMKILHNPIKIDSIETLLGQNEELTKSINETRRNIQEIGDLIDEAVDESGQINMRNAQVRLFLDQTEEEIASKDKWAKLVLAQLHSCEYPVEKISLMTTSMAAASVESDRVKKSSEHFDVQQLMDEVERAFMSTVTLPSNSSLLLPHRYVDLESVIQEFNVRLICDGIAPAKKELEVKSLKTSLAVAKESVLSGAEHQMLIPDDAILSLIRELLSSSLRIAFLQQVMTAATQQFDSSLKLSLRKPGDLRSFIQHFTSERTCVVFHINEMLISSEDLFRRIVPELILSLEEKIVLLKRSTLALSNVVEHKDTPAEMFQLFTREHDVDSERLTGQSKKAASCIKQSEMVDEHQSLCEFLQMLFALSEPMEEQMTGLIASLVPVQLKADEVRLAAEKTNRRLHEQKFRHLKDLIVWWKTQPAKTISKWHTVEGKSLVEWLKQMGYADTTPDSSSLQRNCSNLTDATSSSIVVCGSTTEPKMLPSASAGQQVIPPQNEFVIDSCVRCHSGSKPLQLQLCLHPMCIECSDGTAVMCHDRVLKIVCPICKMITRKADLLVNLWYQQTAGSTASDLSNRICSSCDERAKATGFCANCNEFLCAQCADAHSRVRITKSHVVKSISELNGQDCVSAAPPRKFPCTNHPQEELKIFCDNCNQMTCRDCQLTIHKGHKHSLLKELAPGMRRSLTEAMNTRQSQMSHMDKGLAMAHRRIDEVKERETQLRAILMKAIEDISMTILERGSLLVDHIKGASLRKREHYQNIIAQIENLKGLHKQAYNFAEVAIETPGDVALLLAKQRLSKQMLAISTVDQSDFLNPLQEPIKIDLVLDHKNELIGALDKFGEVLLDRRVCSAENLNLTPHPTACTSTASNGHSQPQLPALIAAPPQRFPMPSTSGLNQMVRPVGSSNNNNGNGNAYQYGSGAAQLITNRFVPPTMPSATQMNPNLRQALAEPSSLKMSSQPFARRSGPPPPIRYQGPIATPPNARPGPMGLPSTAPVNVQRPPVITTVKSLAPQPAVSRAPQVVPTAPIQGQMSQTASPQQQQSTNGSKDSPTVSNGTPAANLMTSSPKTVQPRLSSPGTTKKEERPSRPESAEFTTVLVEDESSSQASATSSSASPGSSDGAPRIVMKIVKNPSSPRFQHQGKWMRPKDADTRSPSWWDDYCAVCANGCAEDEQLVCCSRCPKVFHGKCHIPPFTDVPDDDWNCARCEPLPDKKLSQVGSNQLTRYERQACLRVLLELCCTPNSADFHAPVPRETRNYYKVIQQPMDFSTIQRNLLEDKYHSTLEFIQHLNLVFGNCAAFNSSTSLVGKSGLTVGAKYKELIDEYFGAEASGQVDLSAVRIRRKRQSSKPLRQSKRSRVARLSESSSESSFYDTDE